MIIDIDTINQHIKESHELSKKLGDWKVSSICYQCPLYSPDALQFKCTQVKFNISNNDILDKLTKIIADVIAAMKAKRCGIVLKLPPTDFLDEIFPQGYYQKHIARAYHHICDLMGYYEIEYHGLEFREIPALPDVNYKALSLIKKAAEMSVDIIAKDNIIINNKKHMEQMYDLMLTAILDIAEQDNIDLNFYYQQIIIGKIK